jgi:hypothetical protein
MSPANRIAPPTVVFAADEPPRPVTAALDADWDFAVEPAATDGGLMGKPDVELGEFPAGPSDLEMAALIDECTDALCRPSRAGRRLPGGRARPR